MTAPDDRAFALFFDACIHQPTVYEHQLALTASEINRVAADALRLGLVVPMIDTHDGKRAWLSKLYPIGKEER